MGKRKEKIYMDIVRLYPYDVAPDVDTTGDGQAAMVSNLLVVLCGSHDAQPVVNLGSLY